MGVRFLAYGYRAAPCGYPLLGPRNTILLASAFSFRLHHDKGLVVATVIEFAYPAFGFVFHGPCRGYY